MTKRIRDRMRLDAKNGSGSRRSPLRIGTCTTSALDIGAAYGALFLMMFKVPGLTLFPVGAIVALFLLSIGFFRSSIREKKDLQSLVSASLVAAAIGLTMRYLLNHERDFLSSELGALALVGWLAATPAIVIAAIWCFERVDVHRGLVILATGAAASAVVTSVDLSWKFGIGLPMTMVGLALAAGHNLFWTRIVLLSSACISAANDARTMALISITVLACTFVGKRRVNWMRTYPKTSLLGISTGFAVMSYVMVQSMMSGLFGPEIQRRTVEQTSGGRDLLTSGRSEWAASIELFMQSPLGFGTGVTPGNAMQTDALKAIAAAGGDFTAEQYWTINVFGDRLDLHSTTANLWAHFGLGGVAVAVVVALIFTKAFPLCVSAIRPFGALPLFAVLAATWDLLFSPMVNYDRIAFALIAALVLLSIDGLGLWPATQVFVRVSAPAQGPTVSNRRSCQQIGPQRAVSKAWHVKQTP